MYFRHVPYVAQKVSCNSWHSMFVIYCSSFVNNTKVPEIFLVAFTFKHATYFKSVASNYFRPACYFKIIRCGRVHFGSETPEIASRSHLVHLCCPL
jgi:hypothetical protein